MELRQLEYFVAVAEELSFTRAAARLHVVQSAVSAAIRSLERELGPTLFERSSQRVALTSAGAALLPEARNTLDAARAAREAAQLSEGRLRGTLHIGTFTSLVRPDLPQILGRFHRLHPAVTLRLAVSPRGSAGLVERLLAGSLDLAFVSLPGDPPAGLRVREIYTAPMALLVPAEHPLARSDGPRELTELVEEPFIDTPPGYGNREVTDRAFARAGLHRQVVLEATDVGTVASYVRAGLGVAFLHDSTSGVDSRGLAVLPLADPTLRWTLSVAVSATRRASAPLRALLEVLETSVPTDPPQS
ncbi:LysR family transcriptional regulator [Streptomyces sp. NPDC093228]|jgi:DNA-binding transcriptional LysR family regulator|uniref:LysR family transcriptional regulator n=1 Tax=unclassified Streptomyces TaxID=2593676 RepID=UPI000741399C|nr:MULTISPECIES: LysR family transcriptional regulator [unclassified Streptomyces]KUJ35586.1 LysR family transcriptional regulator [Streptomyces sp. NRRL F-5122]MDX3260543.1 LysR family transcriptional regulator [Streptomyces sp. MI02-2A]REE63822.1 DNA-binding transcriptional LysR family regulator [Streptomyces sp. 3212.3]